MSMSNMSLISKHSLSVERQTWLGIGASDAGGMHLVACIIHEIMRIVEYLIVRLHDSYYQTLSMVLTLTLILILMNN